MILTLKPAVHNLAVPAELLDALFPYQAPVWCQWLPPSGSNRMRRRKESEQLQQHQSRRDVEGSLPSHRSPLPRNPAPSPSCCSPSASPDLLDSLVCKQRSQRCLSKAVSVPKTSKGESLALPHSALPGAQRSSGNIMLGDFQNAVGRGPGAGLKTSRHPEWKYVFPCHQVLLFL